jgi:hypothetical protein
MPTLSRGASTVRCLALSLALLYPVALGAQNGATTAAERTRATAINQEVLHIAATRTLWPGYRPDTVPLAIYTGGRTFLFRHPAPPPEFLVHDGVHSVAGRYPAVTSNSSANIGGVVTATLLADGTRARLTVPELAAVAVHEAFHVFQRKAHPTWQGNEGDLFTYPADHADVLRLRREESEFLRRALAASGAARNCLAREAMARRAERFAQMDPAHAAYERGSEMNEGLATYVQLRATGKTTVAIPAEEYLATGIRDRFYTVGPALAFLLDQVQLGWQGELDRNDSLRLDGMLTEAVEASTGRCALPPSVVRRIAEVAAADVQGVATVRLAARKHFDQRAGWRLVIEPAAGAPLWPQGFDPLNVAQVIGGTLHHRMLKLGNDSLSVEFVDGDGADFEALTEAAGAHPLFNGIRRVEIVFLAKPVITQEGRVVTISAPGLQGRFVGVVVEDGDERLVVRARR